MFTHIFNTTDIVIQIFKVIPHLFLILFLALPGIAQEIKRLDEQGNPIKTESYNSQFVSGEVIIKFEESYLDREQLDNNDLEFQLGTGIVTHTSLRNSLLAKGGIQLHRVVTKLRPSHMVSTSRTGQQIPIPDLHNLMLMEVDQSSDIIQLCIELNDLQGIEFAEPNYILTLSNDPNDPKYNLQKGFDQTNNIDIDADIAWDYTVSDYTVKIGIIDSGIDYDNEDLGDGDFGFEGAKVRGGWDYFNNDPDPDDDNIFSHGTSCAGISGALRNNNLGVAGLSGGDVDGSNNIGCQLFAFKVGGTGLQINTALAIDAIIEASIWTPTFGYGCHVLNISWSGPIYSESLRYAVLVAYMNNVVFAASTGNDPNPINIIDYPAGYDQSWTFAVGASDELDERAVYTSGQESNYGIGIDFVAPGVTDLVHTTKIGQSNYNTFSGTSAAAPHVAGLSGLILSVNPTLHVEDIQGIIKASADKVPGYTYNSDGWNEEMGFGRINAGTALEIMHSPWSLNHHSVTGGTSVSNTDYYSIVFYNPGGGLATGSYTVKRYDVRKTVSLSNQIVGEPYVWGRGANATSGWSAAYPNWQVGYCNVVSSTTTSAVLQTFVYEVFDAIGQSDWYPVSPSGVTFAYTVLGKQMIAPIISHFTQNPNPICKGSGGSVTAYISQGNPTPTYTWTLLDGAPGFSILNTTGNPCQVVYNNTDLLEPDEVTDALIRCTATNGGGSYTENYIVELVNDCSSCPTLAFEVDGEMVDENPLLITSLSNPGTDVTDYYLIQNPITPDGDEIDIRIHEPQTEHTWLDYVELIEVKVKSNELVAVNDEGEVINYKTGLPPVTVILNGETDITEILSEFDTLNISLSEGDVLTISREGLSPEGGSDGDIVLSGIQPIIKEESFRISLTEKKMLIEELKIMRVITRCWGDSFSERTKV